LAKIQFLSVDNTHIKYLEGKDEKIWKGYLEAIKSQRALERILEGGAIRDNS